MSEMARRPAQDDIGGESRGWFRPGLAGAAIDPAYLITVVRERGKRLIEITEAYDLSTPLPTCPGQVLGDIPAHLGALDAWVAGMVRAQSPAPISGDAIVAPKNASDRPAWFAARMAEAAEVLAAADPQALMWAPGGAGPTLFWLRRIAHEAVVHTADAEIAAGADLTRVRGDLARDGIDELLDLLPYAPRTGGRVGEPDAEGGARTIALGDPTSRTVWRIDWTPPTFSWSSARVPLPDSEAWNSDVAEWAPQTRDAGVRVYGMAHDLYLAMYGRPTGRRQPHIDGDVAIWAQWQAASAL